MYERKKMHYLIAAAAGGLIVYLGKKWLETPVNRG
jgi:hypothetical protein